MKFLITFSDNNRKSVVIDKDIASFIPAPNYAILVIYKDGTRQTYDDVKSIRPIY